jgi:hypothetical protein
MVEKEKLVAAFCFAEGEHLLVERFELRTNMSCASV